jgi:hypothetical protein
MSDRDRGRTSRNDGRPIVLRSLPPHGRKPVIDSCQQLIEVASGPRHHGLQPCARVRGDQLALQLGDGAQDLQGEDALPGGRVDRVAQGLLIKAAGVQSMRPRVSSSRHIAGKKRLPTFV